MSWVAAHAIELTVLALFFALLAWHGWQGRRASRRLADFYVGGRSLGGFVIGLSFYSTFFSTNSFVGHAGRSYAVGLSWMVLGVVCLVFALISWHVLAERMRRFTERLGSLTVPDFLGFRYQSQAVRLASALVIVVAALFYVVAIFKGVSHLLAAFLDIPYGAALAGVAVVVAAYTAAGGFIAVVKTDAVQAVLMLLGSVLILLAAVGAAGGWGAALEEVAALSRPLPDGRSLGTALLSFDGLLPFGMLLGISLAGGLKLLAEPRQITRFYAIRDRRALRVAMIVAPTAIGLGFFCLLPVGVLAHVLLPPGVEFVDTDRITPYLLGEMHLLGQPASAIVLTAFLGAALSSLDSVLLIVGSSIQRDLWEQARPARSEAASLAGTRSAILLYTFVGALMAYRPPGDIVDLTAFSGSLYAACFLPPLLMGLYHRGATRAAALATLGVGFVVVFGWKYVSAASGWLPTVHEVFPGLLAGFATFLLVSACTGPPDSALLDSLFPGTR